MNGIQSAVMPTNRAKRHFTLLTLLALTIALVLGGCASRGDRTAGWSAEQLYSEAKRAMDGANFEGAIEYFEILEARYPFGDLAMQAQLDLAYSYYRFGEHDAALSATDRFIRIHPTHPAVAYAYYLRGVIQYNKGERFLNRWFPRDLAETDQRLLRSAYEDFHTVVERYPDTEYADDARQRLIYLRNEMARHEYEVARFYFRRSAFAATVNRIDYLIANYDGAPVMPEALVLQAEALEALGLEDRADDVRRVLSENWPEHPRASLNETAASQEP